MVLVRISSFSSVSLRNVIHPVLRERIKIGEGLVTKGRVLRKETGPKVNFDREKKRREEGNWLY